MKKDFGAAEMSICQERPLPPPSGLIHSAMQDAISFFVFGLLLFIFPWPNIVTYILFALLLKSIVNLLLAYLRIGLYQMVDLTERGNTQRVLRETISVLIYSGAALLSVRFLGW